MVSFTSFSCLGTVLMDLRLSSLVPDVELPSPQFSSLSESDLSIPRAGSKVSFLETTVGQAALILANWIRDYVEDPIKPAEKELLDDCVRIIVSAIQAALSEPRDDGGSEVLYGRAGLLYALLWLRSELSFPAPLGDLEDTNDPLLWGVSQLYSDENLQALVGDIVRRGWLGASIYAEELDAETQQRAPRLMWSWHGKRYLGAAHGVAGILQVLICAPAHIIAPYWSDITGTVEWLLAIQEPLGNWPTKASRHMHYAAGGAATSRTAKRVSVEDGDALVQWCHGAPGVLILLSTLLTRASTSSKLAVSSTTTDSIVAALQRGGELVYTRGLLRKGVGLCHGVAGSVYALLAVVDSVQEPAGYWLARAAHLALLATGYRAREKKGDMRVPEKPYSLYEGVGGGSGQDRGCEREREGTGWWASPVGHAWVWRSFTLLGGPRTGMRWISSKQNISLLAWLRDCFC